MNKKELIQILMTEFRKTGYEGLSLSQISKSTGLGKASLYHHFPNGKKEMSLEVLKYTNNWVQTELYPIVNKDLSPNKKLDNLMQTLNEFYFKGENSCLLDVMSIENSSENELNIHSKEILLNFTNVLNKLAKDFGKSNEEASMISQIALSIFQGALIQTRILKDKNIFQSQVSYVKNLFKI